ncbi:hypothetical protein [Saccharothrix sp. NRRL B-16314]|uniref:hypothetical protein n=1 Tax=Saccharothrix sp. NRRL B-16314 TaxID=1463825 RepID=UPI000527E192|nr:hypothetical protein [Saccharothrix sp. NRRL B-16314]
MASDPNAWYYCLTHQTVEHGVGCRGGDRMGPYPDEATAQRALDLARERTKAEDKSDKEWGKR